MNPAIDEETQNINYSKMNDIECMGAWVYVCMFDCFVCSDGRMDGY